MDNNPTNDILQILKFSKSFIEKARTGEGLGLNEEQKKEFVEKMKGSEAEEKINALKKNLEELERLGKQ